MGTSGSYGGPGSGSPLIPSWLEDPASDNTTGADGAVDPTGDGAAAVSDGAPPVAPTTATSTPVPAPRISMGSMRAPRREFNRFAKSGGSDPKSLRRGVSKYVSGTTGGARNAASRMGSSIDVGDGLARFLHETRTRGVREALRGLELERLAGRPVEEVFLALAEYVCPHGGSVDEGISRDAFMETIADLASNGITTLDGLTVEQMQIVLELYATHAIEARLCNDIGVKAIVLPVNARAVAEMQRQLGDYIRRGVSDALTKARDALVALTPDRVTALIRDVYEAAFEVLRIWGEAEE